MIVAKQFFCLYKYQRYIFIWCPHNSISQSNKYIILNLDCLVIDSQVIVLVLYNLYVEVIVIVIDLKKCVI